MRLADSDIPPPPVVYVGVDGGGTTCRVRLRRPDGQLCGEALGGPANVNLAFDLAIATISDTIGAALGLIRWPAPPVLHVGVGLAGVSSAGVAERVRRALAMAAATLVVTSDADIACVGAHAGADGGLIVAGTGSGAVARIAGRSVSIAGRGFLLGDDGSGARMGLDALRVALRAHDDLVPHTPLTRSLMDRFGNDPVAAIDWGRGARSADFAGFAPEVLAAAAAGDAVGVTIVQHAADAIADLAAALRRRGATRVSLVGGLAGAIRPFLAPTLAEDLAAPVLDALDGALLLAGCPIPAPGPPDRPR